MPTVSSTKISDRPKGAPPPDPSTFVPVRTTLPRRPLPPNHARPHVTTERLILRPLVPEDLDAMHALRTQPEVMYWTIASVVDPDPAFTQTKIDIFLPPRDVELYNCAICLRSTGEVIGLGGNHNWASSFGWPEVGYMIRKEHWGKGLGTEFLRGFTEGIWNKLEREVVEGLMVDKRTVEGEGVRYVDEETGKEMVREQILALTVEANGKSHRVLGKSGFEWFVTWRAEDPVKGDEEGMVEIPTFRYFPKGAKGE